MTRAEIAEEKTRWAFLAIWVMINSGEDLKKMRVGELYRFLKRIRVRLEGTKKK